MDRRVAAAREIGALFGDGGAHVLTEADLPNNWEAALQNVPSTAIVPRGNKDLKMGERLLSSIRDHWGRTRQLRPAIAATRALLRLKVTRLGSEHPDTLLELGALGALADRAGRTEDARGMLEEAWQTLRSTVGGRDMRVAVVAEHVGLHYMRSGDLLKAEAAFEQSHRIRSELAPGSQVGVAAQLGEIWLKRDKWGEAAPLLKEAHALTKEKYGPLHPRTLARARSLAKVLTRMARFDEAEPVLRDLYDDALQSGDKEQIAAAGFEFGVGLMRLGRDEEGYRRVDDAIRLTRELGDPHPALAGRLSIWWKLLLKRRHPDEAEGVAREAIDADRRMHGGDSPQVAVRYTELADLLLNFKRPDEAMGFLDPAVSILRGTLGDKDSRTREAANLLLQLLAMKAQRALELKDKATAREYVRHGKTLLPVVGDGNAAMAALRALPL